MASRWGRSPKNKGLLYGKPPFSASFVVISKKKVFSSESHHFFATFIREMKNNTALFLSNLKLNDLSEIYLGGQTKIWGEPPSLLPPSYMPAGDVTMMTS